MFFIIFVAGTISGIFVVCVMIYSRRRWLRKRQSESSPAVPGTNQSPDYEEVDLKNLVQNKYVSPRGAANDGYSNYADLDKPGDAGNTYQSLK